MTTTALGNEVLDVEAAKGPPQREAEGSRYRFAAMAVCGIWGALAAASIWSPDLISGSDRTHVPIAAFTDWFYAVLATGLVFMAFSRRTPDLGRSSWAAFTLVICGIWLVVAGFARHLDAGSHLRHRRDPRADRRFREPHRRSARHRVRIGLRCWESERNAKARVGDGPDSLGEKGGAMQNVKQAASAFLANKRVAVTGVSRTPKGHGSNLVYKRLRERGYEVFAVNPNAHEVEGDLCYQDLKSIPGEVQAVVIGTRPEIAEDTMHECAELGIKYVWMHRGPGVGSVSSVATDYGRKHGITVIDGGCPLMFGPTADFGHRIMRLVYAGKVPKQVSVSGTAGSSLEEIGAEGR